MKRNTNIVLVTNHLTPYRRKFYDEFHDYCEKIGVNFSVLLMTKCEPKRNWDYEDLKVSYATLLKGIHFRFPINNHLNPSITRQLKSMNPGIVLMAGSYMYYTNWLVLWYKKKLKYPIIYWNEAHFNERRTYNSLVLKIRDSLRRFIFPHFDGYWYSGKMAKKFVEHYSINSPKMYFVPNLIDHEKYSVVSRSTKQEIDRVKTNLKIEPNDFVLIIPARLSIEKGIHCFLELITDCEIKRKLTILIPGTGDYKNEIEKKIPNNPLVQVQLLGFQPQEKMLELYSIADLFVLPSLSDPNPLTCIEALWCGLPLFVSTHVGNYPEVIRPGINGEVFDYSAKQDAKQKLEKILYANQDWFIDAKKESIKIADKIYNSQKVISGVVNSMVADFGVSPKDT